jgi:hypothetical protein
MSSGAIAMVGGAEGGTNVSTMTVGVTNCKRCLLLWVCSTTV